MSSPLSSSSSTPALTHVSPSQNPSSQNPSSGLIWDPSVVGYWDEEGYWYHDDFYQKGRLTEAGLKAITAYYEQYEEQPPAQLSSPPPLPRRRGIGAKKVKDITAPMAARPTWCQDLTPILTSMTPETSGEQDVIFDSRGLNLKG